MKALILLALLSGPSLADDTFKLPDEEFLSEEEFRERDEESLRIYLEEGATYLRSRDYERAIEAFNSAIVIQPDNRNAIRGLKAAEKALEEHRRMKREAAGVQP